VSAVAEAVLIALLMLVCFALGWRVRDVRQDRIEAAEFYDEYERPCEHVHEVHGACEARGRHLFHSKGSGGWSIGWTAPWRPHTSRDSSVRFVDDEGYWLAEDPSRPGCHHISPSRAAALAGLADAREHYDAVRANAEGGERRG
jgi:predicted RNase H-like HicB family nuclease